MEEVSKSDGKVVERAIPPLLNTRGWCWAEYRLECYRELGYALIYMTFLHPDFEIDGRDSWRNQRARIHKLCNRAAGETRLTLHIWKKLYTDIKEEIENLV